MKVVTQYKADFHTHSVASPDGSLTMRHYERMLESGRLDYIAVTDHDTISMALALQARLGSRIIVGEEIMTLDGEIIGLYLSEPVLPGLSARMTVKHIKAQGGLVYIPHPFETVRKGIAAALLSAIADEVDIIEAYNGRAVFQNKTPLALEWAATHAVPGAASSDAHGWSGWGRTYTVLMDTPSAATLPALLADATYSLAAPGIRGMLYPKVNRVKKWGRRA